MIEKIHTMQQEHLLQHTSTLPEEEIARVDIETLARQQKLLKQNSHPKTNLITPFTSFDKKGNRENILNGQQLIAEGKVGCLVVAGGQGTRLGFEGPKGLYPVSVIKNKTLFQLIAERTASASLLAKRELPLAIMTSPQNDTETRQYFADHNNFGLNSSQIFFFTQEQLPLLDESGNLFLETPKIIAKGPDGNGNALKHFVSSGTWKEWQAEGVEYLNFILVDNPLADPWDAELIGYHHKHQADVIIKCIKKTDPDEKVGVLVEENKKITVIEYTELPEQEKTAVDSKGKLRHRCANISLFSFDMNFVEKISTLNLPLHLAHKAAKYLTPDGSTKKSETPIAWKFETFIFDVITEATKVRALMYPREEVFSPLKNGTGPNSPATIKEALQNSDKIAWKQVSGTTTPDFPFELSTQFHYPTPELLQQWHNQPFPNKNYIDRESQ